MTKIKSLEALQNFVSGQGGKLTLSEACIPADYFTAYDSRKSYKLTIYSYADKIEFNYEIKNKVIIDFNWNDTLRVHHKLKELMAIMGWTFCPNLGEGHITAIKRTPYTCQFEWVTKPRRKGQKSTRHLVTGEEVFVQVKIAKVPCTVKNVVLKLNGEENVERLLKLKPGTLSRWGTQGIPFDTQKLLRDLTYGALQPRDTNGEKNLIYVYNLETKAKSYFG